MKVYDCFTFYNEFELLELRLKSLWDMVDYFILVEADKNHINQSKPFYFGERIAEFKEFLPKIRHVPLRFNNVEYKGVGDWTLENAQRNGIMYGLLDSEPDDLVIISDVDEFPAPDIIQRINENNVQLISQCSIAPLADGRMLTVPCQILIPALSLLDYVPVVLDQKFHYYYLDWIAKGTWKGTKIVKRKNLRTPQEIRKLNNNIPFILNGGWHFSYMGGVDRIIKKMTSIVDGNELVVKSDKNLTDKDYVKECMRTGKDIYGRENVSESQFYPYDISNINLSYLNEFVKKYPYFLREYDFGKDDV